MSELNKVEYRVRKVERYIVTRHHESPDSRSGGTEQKGESGGTEQKGEYDNAEMAHEVAYALCAEEHRRLGWALDDPRITYPTGDERYPTLMNVLHGA